jgi:outer membrane biosynthesis protein TonB
MTQLPHDTKSSTSIAIRRPPTQPRWLWLVLLGGSTVIHSVLAIAAMPLLGRLAKPPVDAASIPIELVELSTINPTYSADASPDVPQSVDPSPEAVTSVPSKIVGPIPPELETNAPVAAPAPKPVAPSIAPPSVPVPAPTPSSAPVPAPPSVPAPAPSPSSAPAPPLQPETSEFLTVPIDRPPPDVSETLPTDPADPSSLAQVEVDEARTPVRLVASLEAERIPVEQAADNPDQLAAPVGGVVQQDVATLGDAACLNAVTPAILQAIGTRTGVQVATDAAGQVVQTILQTSSQNPDYDRLVECLVQHWNFNPAETANQPVPSRALLVWVTIEPRDRASSEP